MALLSLGTIISAAACLAACPVRGREGGREGVIQEIRWCEGKVSVVMVPLVIVVEEEY